MTPRSENSLSMGVLLHPAVGYTSVERVSGPPLWELCGLGFVLYLKTLKTPLGIGSPSRRDPGQ